MSSIMRNCIIGAVVGIVIPELGVKFLRTMRKESKNKRSFVIIDGKYYEADILAAEEA